MTTLTDGNREWLDFDGMTVRLDGIGYKVKAASFNAIYPYARQTLTVDLEMTDKQSPEYLAVKRQLGDDWSTDLMASDSDLPARVLMACRSQATRKANARATKLGLANLGVAI